VRIEERVGRKGEGIRAKGEDERDRETIT